MKTNNIRHYLVMTLAFVCCFLSAATQSLKLLKEESLSFAQPIQLLTRINYRKAELALTSAKDLDSIYLSREPILPTNESVNSSWATVFKSLGNVAEKADLAIDECMDVVYVILVPSNSTNETAPATAKLTIKSNGEGMSH